jgi:hypothetical protein
MDTFGCKRALARRILDAAFVNGDQVLTEKMLDEIIFRARQAGAGAAFHQLERSEYQWHGLRTNYLPQL